MMKDLSEVSRPSWDTTWMDSATVVAQRSRCSRRKAGCVIVSANNSVVSVGYNGPPSGWQPEDYGKRLALHMGEGCGSWCDRACSGGTPNQYDDCPSVHAEINAIIRGNMERAIRGTAYVTSCPCLSCAKALSNIGLSYVVMNITEEDRDRTPQQSIDMFNSSDIAVTVIDSVLGKDL